jgi:uncharacterized protein YjbI with pentapeptide repeats
MKTSILFAVLMAGSVMAQGKDLSNEYLYGAKLAGQDLRDADFSKAQLAHADLKGADLRGADLSEAFLFMADLSGADLRGANLPSKMVLAKVNLKGAKFDPSTQLPFTRDEAVRRGMVMVLEPAGSNVAVALNVEAK